MPPVDIKSQTHWPQRKTSAWGTEASSKQRVCLEAISWYSVVMSAGRTAAASYWMTGNQTGVSSVGQCWAKWLSLDWLFPCPEGVIRRRVRKGPVLPVAPVTHKWPIIWCGNDMCAGGAVMTGSHQSSSPQPHMRWWQSTRCSWTPAVANRAFIFRVTPKSAAEHLKIIWFSLIP